MREDESFINGMEEMFNVIKECFELSPEERKERFGETMVAHIMDKHDFLEVYDRMTNPIEVKYVIRGIMVNDYGQKKVVVESDPLTFKPDELLVNAFLNCHKKKNIAFAAVEEIYVKK